MTPPLLLHLSLQDNWLSRYQRIASAEKAAGDKQMWDGNGGIASAAGGLSDKRAKENIIKIKYSD